MADVVQWIEEDLQDTTLILESRLLVVAPEATCLVGQSSEKLEVAPRMEIGNPLAVHFRLHDS
jgi:hypothetical protein